jgi:hypothetical protein
MSGAFNLYGVGLLILSVVMGLIGLMLKNRRVGWTLVAISLTGMYIVL